MAGIRNRTAKIARMTGLPRFEYCTRGLVCGSRQRTKQFMFGLWQFLSGWRNPTRHWHADPARSLSLDLDEHRLCGVGIGEPMQSLAFFGPAASWSHEWEFPHHGITLLEADHGLAEFAVYLG